jgi:hypothetical protein
VLRIGSSNLRCNLQFAATARDGERSSSEVAVVVPSFVSDLHPHTRGLEDCGLVVRVPGYRSRGPGLDSRRYQIIRKVVGQQSN